MLTQSLINQQGLICCLTMLLYFLIATSFHIYYSIPIRDIAVRLVPQLFSMTFEHLISLKSCLRAFSMNIGQSVSESVDSDFFFV